jgi:hypothetical protein
MDKRSRSSKEIVLIGKLVKKLYPDLAKEITAKYIWPEAPCSDYKYISLFFDEFCRIKNINPELIKGPQFKTRLVDQRRLFVSAMIRLYNPQLYGQGDSIMIKYGFNAYLGKFLKMKKQTMHTTVKDCVNQENIYDSIRSEVSDLVAKLLLKVDGSGEII